MPKISLIGAGSVVFARRLFQDLVSTHSLDGSTVSLMDVDASRMGVIADFARRLIKDSGSRVTVEETGDRHESLDGADYVLVTIRVGDDPAIDSGIPRKYGIDQAVGDTIGPGGVFKALRTVPVLLDICHDMETLCPDAWLLNYTNPMAISSWAISEDTSVNALGLCHSVQHTTERLAGYIGASREDVSAWVAGINHMAWFLRFERDGRDAYPDLWRALDDQDICAKDTVRFEIMRRFGYFVTESTRHMSEYVPYFRTRAEDMERFGLREVSEDLGRLEERDRSYFSRMRAELESAQPLTATRSEEYACRIIEAMESGTATVVNGNVPNDGLITNLTQGCCVEVPCVVDGLGVHPMSVGALPPQLAALNMSSIAVHELATTAVLEGSREAALHAVMLDPLTAAVLPLNRIVDMFDEMWAAHGDGLALYE